MFVTVGKGAEDRIEVSTLQFAELNALLKKVAPDLGVISTLAWDVSPAALAMLGMTNANNSMKIAIAELKSFIILSCQMCCPRRWTPLPETLSGSLYANNTVAAEELRCEEFF
ncbi:MAG: hypothetical protein WEB05_03055 [Solirubrobacterales bacterium]